MKRWKIVYLEQLVWLKTLILTNMNILFMELNLMDMEVSYFLELD